LRAGELDADKGDYRNALRLLSQVVEKDPGNPVHFVARGDVYMKAHTYRYAIYDYGMALDLDPANGDVYYRRGEAYLKTGNTKNACFDFERALHYGKKKAILYLQKYCGK
jgi:predicted Zn-dependent protease